MWEQAVLRREFVVCVNNKEITQFALLLSLFDISQCNLCSLPSLPLDCNVYYYVSYGKETARL